MYISDVPFTKGHVTGSSVSFLNDVKTNDKETVYFPILFYVLINVFPPEFSFFSKSYFYTSFRNPQITAATVPLTSQIRAIAKLLLLIVYDI
jgi:hypothetical protein